MAAGNVAATFLATVISLIFGSIYTGFTFWFYLPIIMLAGTLGAAAALKWYEKRDK